MLFYGPSFSNGLICHVLTDKKYLILSNGHINTNSKVIIVIIITIIIIFIIITIF